jgi:hypothetical protein
MQPPTKIMKRAIYLWLTVGGVVLMAAHLITLNMPRPTNNEAAIVNSGLYGSLKLWDPIVPAPLRFCECLYTSGELPAVVGAVVKFMGVGVFQARLLCFLAAFGSLVILSRLICFWGMSECLWGILFFALGVGFISPSHAVRPEGFLAVVMAANLSWFFRGRRIGMVGLLLGASAGFMWAFHPAIVLFFALIPAVLYLEFDERRPFDPKSLILWCFNVF